MEAGRSPMLPSSSDIDPAHLRRVGSDPAPPRGRSQAGLFVVFRRHARSDVDRVPPFTQELANVEHAREPGREPRLLYDLAPAHSGMVSPGSSLPPGSTQ